MAALSLAITAGTTEHTCGRDRTQRTEAAWDRTLVGSASADSHSGQDEAKEADDEAKEGGGQAEEEADDEAKEGGGGRATGLAPRRGVPERRRREGT